MPGDTLLLSADDPLTNQLVIHHFDEMVYPITKITTDVDEMAWDHINALAPIIPYDLR
ncbi:hypothetical protein RYR28_002475 [Edwardsiella piscicida]|uniref:hypothetical protein n=1 Tax=Edwardsiella piscicida TaxID=1263550 RepID=UPI0014554B41|nr:hypothetical protein [Edwardsiella piscicida]